MLGESFFRRFVGEGTLRIIESGGGEHVFAGSRDGPDVTIRFRDPGALRFLLVNPALRLGEAWMAGRVVVEKGDLYDFLDLCGRNYSRLEQYPPYRATSGLSRLARRFWQWNPAARARRNVARHYDLSGRLYDLFLDSDRQYSCGYYESGNDSLEIAQRNKKRHLAAKLLLEPGQKVLDIGSGWGGLGLYLAENTGVDVTGLTLSREQHAHAAERADKAGLAERVRFHLRDYREETGSYDRIVSVGMFEHVGINHYREFFGKVRDLLADDGVALLHSIGRMESPSSTNPWVRKYIFPGGYAPALSEVLEAIEKVGLWVTDIEILRLHYAETLRDWRLRFAANRERAREIYDERFCRMWEFYLTSCEVAFRHMDQMVFQIQLAKRQDAVPLTRGYIDRFEAAPAAHPSLVA